MKQLLFCLGLAGLMTAWTAPMAWSQALTSLRGTISDPSGAVIPGAKVTLTNVDTGIERVIASGSDGVYDFLQVSPGNYRLTVEAPSFRKFLRENIELLVNSPATVNVTLEVGHATEVVAVSAEAPLLNTTDASLGNAIGETQVKQLPLEARNVAGLYALEPGVVSVSSRQDFDVDNDTRSGAVNGAHSDQSNITLDGVDVNDQAMGYAFTSVLRMNPDAMQEFRVTTTNYNADQGRSSGAQVAIVTKSGSNNLHGSLYEYNRNTATSANDWFIKRAELSSGEPNQAPKLIRNIFGGSVGGPIKKDRAFFFVNFDGRRDREADSVVRTVPTATLRQGTVQYQYCPNGNYDANGLCNEPLQVQALAAQQIQAMDPLGLGPNPVMLQYFQSYPEPNDNSVGDGLNYSGYRFPGAAVRHFDTFIARLDYKLTANGNHNLFWRGNAQPWDLDRGAPFLPGLSSEVTNEDYTKGFVLGYSAILRPTLVNNFRWGLTRQSHAALGDSTLPWNYFRSLDQGITRTHEFTLPVNNFVDDLSWVKGRHTLGFGTNARFIRNSRFSLASSFTDGVTNASWLATAGIANTGSDMDPAINGFPAVDPSFNNSYDFPLIALLGSVTEVDNVYNSDKQGSLLSQGTPLRRHFGVDEYEFYAQDAFRIKPNFTLTYGLRYELMSPPWETTGLQVAPNVNMGQWFQQRGINMMKGLPSNQDPLISFDLAGPANGKPGYYNWAKKDFAPRLAFAYSPRPRSEFLKRVFGEGDKTSIRAGFGVVYDRIGMGLLNSFDSSGSFGLSSTITNPAGIQTLDAAPRLTSLNVIPSIGACPAPSGSFPRTPPSNLDCGFSISWGLDNSIRTPYSYMLDFSLTRELPKNTTLEVAYVGHLSHRLLTQEDLAMPLDWRDPKSGVDYFTATAALSRIGTNCGNPPCTSSVTSGSVSPQIANFWADLFGPPPAGGYPTGIGNTNDAVQAAYDLFSDPLDGFLYNETTGLFVLDYFGYPATPVTGLNTFYNSQYSSLYAWRSIGNANYHALQVSVRRRMAQGVQFDLNYTFSKSIDLMSDAERIGPWAGLGGEVINSWSHRQMRAVSDFDATHQFNSNWVVELPFGKSRHFGTQSRGVVDALIGGWQVSGIYAISSGFPVNISNGYLWPTNWQLGGQAVLLGKAPVTQTTKNPDGTVNMFKDGIAAIGAFRHPLPGESGNRNVVRGDGAFGWDMGLGKRWKMPYAEGHSLQFRWEVFNVPNATRFNVQSNPPELDVGTTFGNYTGLLTNPRIMQFALRYEF